MASVKRCYDGTAKEARDSTSSSPFIAMFEVFKDELDQHHDRRERIIKASRDITALSKKVIFALQRVRALKQDTPDKIAAEVQERFTAISNLFNSISPDLQSVNSWRYQRQISAGIQELIEAVSLDHYLRTQKLVTQTQAQESIPGGIQLTGDDYLLGLFDLVGELMRFAITTMAINGSLAGSKDDTSADERTILMDLRSLRAYFEVLDTSSCRSTSLGKDVQKKMDVMAQSVEKVETAVYGMIIRGRERPKGWVPDLTADDNHQ